MRRSGAASLILLVLTKGLSSLWPLPQFPSMPREVMNLKSIKYETYKGETRLLMLNL